MRFVIFGGTGSLGTETIKQLLSSYETKTILCVSRDELKQARLKKEINDKRLSFQLTDVRDADAVKRCIPEEIDSVFHFAALKHVDIGEEFPEEFIKTNVLGTINIAKAAKDARVKFCALSSTDKAVDPINTYGMTKGIAEKLFFSLNPCSTRFSVYRWGNVFGSRGSAIHSFVGGLKGKREVDITDPRMTRFWIKIADAAKFMLSTYKTASLKEAMIPPIKACSIVRVVDALASKLDIKSYNVNVVGIRPGEKIDEALVSSHQVGPIHSSLCDIQMTDDELLQMVAEEIK